VRDAQDVASDLHTLQIRFDFFDQRTQGGSVVRRHYFPGILIACNGFPQILVRRTFQEQIVAERNLDRVAADAQILVLASDGNNVRFLLSVFALGSKPRDDSVGSDEFKNV
jgi:hypothetical protein